MTWAGTHGGSQEGQVAGERSWHPQATETTSQGDRCLQSHSPGRGLNPLMQGLCPHLARGETQVPSDLGQEGATCCLDSQTLILANAGVPVAPLKSAAELNSGRVSQARQGQRTSKGSCRGRSRDSRAELRKVTTSSSRSSKWPKTWSIARARLTGLVGLGLTRAQPGGRLSPLTPGKHSLYEFITSECSPCKQMNRLGFVIKKRYLLFASYLGLLRVLWRSPPRALGGK